MSSRPVIMLLPYESCSGLELFGMRFAADLLGRGIPALVAAPDATLIAEQCHSRKIPRQAFPVIKKYEPWSLPACINMLRQHQPSAVVAFRSQLMYPLHLARLLTGIHTPIFMFYRIGAGNYMRKDPLHRRLFRHLSAVVPNADHVANKIRQYWAIDPDKVVCIKSGVDTRRYRPDEQRRAALRAELGISEKDFLIGSSGRIHPEKGSEILLRTLFDESGPAHASKEVHLLYIGREYQPGYIDQLKAVAESIGAASRFHVLPFRNDVEAVYSALDLFAFAVTSHETYAYVVLEAMASGVPVLVPHTGGMKEMFADEVEGWFFEHRNQESLRSVLNKILHTESARIKDMGNLARQKIVKTASWDKMMDQYLQLFRKCKI
ncbi:MAG: glycosyltransferase family 4 protein, partial [Candidatus Riflebacteria bacterium]